MERTAYQIVIPNTLCTELKTRHVVSRIEMDTLGDYTMKKDVFEDLFAIQTRLFRMFQLRNGYSTKEAGSIFLQYDVFGYIEACYEEFHVQGDEANFADIERYLLGKGWGGKH